MNTIEQIDSDLKTAQKEKNEITLSALRNLKSAIKNTEIEKGKSLNEDEVLAVAAKKVKQHKDSIESFTAGARLDLVSLESEQMKVLQKYLPQQMDEATLVEIVKNSISSLSATSADFGAVMKDVVSKVKGQADGAAISKLVKEYLK